MAAHFLSQLPFSLRQTVLGMAYWLKPQRIRHVPALTLRVARDTVRRPSGIPDQNDIQSSPPGFAGLAHNATAADILAAAHRGFYPQNHFGPLKWWSPPRRAVMLLGNVHIAKRFRRTMKNSDVEIAFDRDFEGVLDACAAPRDGRVQLTWITPQVRALYSELHRQGHAHSAEVRNKAGELVGGLFGITVGTVFSALSMFHTEDNASKYAIIALYHFLALNGFLAVDHQVMSPWVEALGGTVVDREDYLAMLKTPGTIAPGPWTATAATAEIAAWEPRTETPAA